MKCYVLAILMLLTPMLANARTDRITYVVHLEDGSQVVATRVERNEWHQRVTVRTRDGRETVYAISEIDRIVRVVPAEQPPPGTPPVRGLRIAGELLGGVGAGMLGASLGIGTKSALVGVLGWAAGVSLGVHAVGDTETETGSYAATLVGSALPVAFAVGLEAAVGEDAAADSIFPILFLGSPIVSTIAFNLTRRYKIPGGRSMRALVDYRDGRLALGAPRVSDRVSPIDGAVTQTVDVLRVRF